jgi:hypothetical protein
VAKFYVDVSLLLLRNEGDFAHSQQGDTFGGQGAPEPLQGRRMPLDELDQAELSDRMRGSIVSASKPS